MSLNWKLRLSLDNRPYPMRFLVISLLLHGAVFLGLEIYLQRMANQTLQTRPEELIPIKFIELPPDQLAVTPPLNAKHRASNNSRAGGTKAGGKAGSRIQSAAGASAARSTPLLTSLNSTQSKPSTRSSSQPQPSQLPQQASPATPPKIGDQNISSPVTAATESSKVPPKPALVTRSAKLKPNFRQLLRPDTNRLALNNNPNISPSPALKPQPRLEPAARPDKLKPSFNQILQPSTKPVVVGNIHPQSSDRLALNNSPNISPSPALKPQPRLEPAARSDKLKPSFNQILQPDTNRLALNNSPNISQSAAPTAPKPSSSNLQRSTSSNPRVTKPLKVGPNTNRLALNRRSNSSRSAASTPPKRSSSSKQSPGQGSSLLGGPVSLASHNFMGTGNALANAARIGTDPEGVDALKDINLGPYLDKLRQEVAQRWHPEGSNSSKQTIISFAVSRTGEVKELRVLKPSGSTKIDEAALEAVQRAAPFSPLPESYSANLLNIHFKFNINIRGQLELDR